MSGTNVSLCVGISTQVSSGPTTGGEGLASEGAKSPVGTGSAVESGCIVRTKATDIEGKFRNCGSLSSSDQTGSSSDMESDGNITIKNASDLESLVDKVGSSTLSEKDVAQFSKVNPHTGAESTNPRRDALVRIRSARRRLQKLEKKDPKEMSAWDREQLVKARQIVNSVELREIIRKGDTKQIPAKKVDPKQTSAQERSTGKEKRKLLTKPSTSDAPGKQAREKDGLANRIGDSGKSAGRAAEARSKFRKKRGRSDEDTQQKIAKKAKGPASQGASEVDENQVAVVDENNPEGKFELDQWQLVEERIQDALIELFTSGSTDEIQFDGAGWEKGYKVVACANKLSKDFLAATLEKLDGIWEGARLRAIPRADIALFQKPKAWVWIPKPYQTPERVLNLLAAQNKELLAGDWKVVKVQPKKEHGQHFLLSLNRQSLPYLEKHQGMVRFSLGKVYVKIVGGGEATEDGGNPSEPPSQ